MEGIKQEMPPAGGYGPIDWAKKVSKKSSYFWIGVAVGYLGVAALGRWWWLNVTRKKMNLKEREMIDARIALSPLLYAERDRLFMKQLRANREEEAELMKDVPDWKVGTLWGKPVYNNPRGKFNLPHNYELYAHTTNVRRGYEKLHH